MLAAPLWPTKSKDRLMRYNLLACTMTAALVLATSQLLSAAEANPPTHQESKARAVSLIEQGKFSQGYDLLKPIYVANPDDLQAAFILGQAALLMNHPAEAADIFRKILAKNANLPRVRTELARAYTALGELQKARDEFQTVLTGSPPPQVGDNIRKFLDAMAAQKSWYARVSGGYIYDSNVNAGPTTSSVLMFGVPFQLSGNAKESSDHGYTLNVGAGHLMEIDKNFGVQSDVQFSNTRYSSLLAFDSNILSLSTGPTLRHDAYIVSMPILYENMRIGQAAYSQSTGFSPQIRVPLTRAISLNAAVIGQTKQYYVNDGIRNGTVWSAIAGTRYDFGESGFLQASFRHTRESTRRDFLDNQSSGFNLGLHTELRKGLFLYLSPGVAYTKYSAQEAAFDQSRRDTQYTMVANLSGELGSSGLAAALGVNYTRNDSNISMYDYQRTQVSIQLSLPF